MNNTLKAIIAVATIVGIAFSVFFFFDNRFASAAELQAVQQRLDYKITADQAQSIQDRIWIIQDRYRNRPMEDTAREELRQLQERKKQLEEQLKSLEGNKDE